MTNPRQFAGSTSSARLSVSAYVDVTTRHAPLQQAAAASGMRHFVLAFLLADGGGCRASWGGQTPLDDPGLLAQVTALREAGGSISVATGGASGSYLENACADAESLASAYGHALDLTGSNALDVDIEQGIDVDKAIGAWELLEQRRGTRLTLTVPVQDAAEGLTGAAMTVLRAAAAHHLDVTTVNAMVMNFGYTGSWAAAMTGAGDAVAAQLRQVWPDLDDTAARRKLGLTFMIGANGTGALTTATDAATVTHYAVSGGAGSLSFWSINRDNGDCPGGGVQPTCSGISQEPDQFARALTAVS